MNPMGVSGEDVADAMLGGYPPFTGQALRDVCITTADVAMPRHDPEIINGLSLHARRTRC